MLTSLIIAKIVSVSTSYTSASSYSQASSFVLASSLVWSVLNMMQVHPENLWLIEYTYDTAYIRLY